MKGYALIVMFALILGSCSTSDPMYNNSPLIQAKSDYTEYQVGQDWYKGQWSIAPQVEHDTLPVICYGSTESFKFKTDSDSIAFDIGVNQTKSFYVQMDETTFAHTIILGVPFQTNPIEFKKTKNPAFQIKHQSEESDYLKELKAAYPLDFLNESMNETEVVLAVMNWTHNKWDHDGNNSPSKSDALTILKEVDEGQEFPCFAYAIVLRDQLNALGYKARTVYLKTQDAKTRNGPAGHVATEIYLNDLQKWVFVDPQFNVLPVLNGKPLNAVEFQNAITHHYDDFELQSAAEELSSKSNYVSFVYDYLYYFDTLFDNRYEKEERYEVDGKRSLMLVPVGAENLSYIKFWDSDVDYCAYTHSIADFYAKPI